MKKILAFAISICLLCATLETSVFAAKETKATLVPGLWHSFLIKDDSSLWGWGINGAMDGYGLLGAEQQPLVPYR